MWCRASCAPSPMLLECIAVYYYCRRRLGRSSSILYRPSPARYYHTCIMSYSSRTCLVSTKECAAMGSGCSRFNGTIVSAVCRWLVVLCVQIRISQTATAVLRGCTSFVAKASSRWRLDWSTRWRSQTPATCIPLATTSGMRDATLNIRVHVYT